MSDSEETGIFRRPSGLGGATEGGKARERRKPKPSSKPASPQPTAGPDAAGTAVKSVRENGLGTIRYDAKGDPVWEWRVEERRRRQDDPTLDMLKALDCQELTIAEETGIRTGLRKGIDPYDHT